MAFHWRPVRFDARPRRSCYHAGRRVAASSSWCQMRACHEPHRRASVDPSIDIRPSPPCRRPPRRSHLCAAERLVHSLTLNEDACRKVSGERVTPLNKRQHLSGSSSAGPKISWIILATLICCVLEQCISSEMKTGRSDVSKASVLLRQGRPCLHLVEGHAVRHVWVAVGLFIPAIDSPRIDSPSSITRRYMSGVEFELSCYQGRCCVSMRSSRTAAATGRCPRRAWCGRRPS